MTLKSQVFKLSYRSNYEENQISFYNKCLENSKYYDRAAGYFSSDIFSIIAEGLEKFVANDGIIRMVVNPHLNRKDILAIETGIMHRDQVIENSILREFDKDLSVEQVKSLALLSWLVSINKLQFRVAFTNEYRLYHEKFGIFTDVAMSRVAFNGSSNETLGGITMNFEKIDVYTDPDDSHRIDSMVNDFNELWLNKTEGLEVIPFTPKIINKLYSFRDNREQINTDNKELDPTRAIELRDYQRKAISALAKNNWNGILEMATGERVIIVTGCINALVSRVSGTFIKNNSCIA